MPQLSPVSWISIFLFLIGMFINTGVVNWWCGMEDYEVKQLKEVASSCHSRLFFWGKRFIKV
uniref:ATP synthase F0 subunit 8 n=1 Tax=Anodonta anatina TaxID=143294 RepID=A0A023I1I9_ANOAN|nr:ATP synthase F0 subunit 8 [Anodonta anatina]AGS17945.1 ATP synthase F0 subunit 8 [Anodonta anatina]